MEKLETLLKKQGVDSIQDLSGEDKQTFIHWEQSLSGRRITDEDVRQFLFLEKEDCINKLSTAELNTRDDIFLKMKLDFLRKLEQFLDAPEMEKKMAEFEIDQISKTLL